MDPLISAIVDAVFAALTEAVGLSDWLRQRLKSAPEKLAFRAVLTQALTAAAAHFPGRDVRYFAEVLPQIGGPLLARYLQPAATLPTGDELTHLWLSHLTIDSTIHYRQDFAAFATFLLDQLNQQMENQQPLQWIVQARRQRSNEEASRLLAEAAMQGVTTLDALRQDVIQLTAALETALKSSSSTVSTAGGAYVAGNVSAHHFAGRDLTIKNYFVTGLARLVIDYGPRIQDFLIEYLGSKRKRVPFGGRQAQLDELHAWLDDPTAPPYYLMTAEAGRGKSALVCRWLAQLTSRPDLDVIFVPISLRFETATQDVVFAALAARLANLYESEPEKLPPAALTAEQWKGVCQSYLRRSPPEGKQLLVILDGLDEATGWTPGRGLFSADPPAGLRVLVTARTRPSETGASGWATTLGWDDPLLARTATLPGLQRRGVEEALASMGNPLDTLATKVDVVGELYRLSEGDPLLVRLYVDALLAQGPAVTTLRAEDLQHIQPGLAGYFERWWQDQQEQWRIQGRDPIAEQAQLRLLLNAIAAALGPLLLDDLAALHPDLADSLLVRRLLQQVSRWLVGDGKMQGYSYSHSRLGYYFWEQLGEHEQQAWDERFVTWGKRILTELNAGTLAPERVSLYLLQHYAGHLKRSHPPAQDFYALISDGWRKAWAVLDISYSGFLNDLEYARQQAIQAYIAYPTRRAEALIQQIRVVLCRASIAALGHNLQPNLLAQLVKEHFYTPTQALAIVKVVTDKKHLSRLLIGVINNLPPELLGEVLRIAQAINDDYDRAEALSVLAPQLPPELIGEAWRIAQAINNKQDRAKALSVLAPRLSPELRREALPVAQTIDFEYDRAAFLNALVPHLPSELLGEALCVAQAIDHAYSRVDALHVLALYLPENERRSVLGDALYAAQAIDHPHVRAMALGILAPELSPSTRRVMFEKELHATPAINDVLDRALTLRALAPHLSREMVMAALPIAQALDSASERILALGSLVAYLEANERRSVLKQVLQDAQSIDNIHSRVEELSALVPYMSERELRTVLTDALCAAQVERRVWMGHEQHPLSILAPFLSGELLREALHTIQAFASAHFRADALRVLAPHLPSQLLGEALHAARTIDYAYGRIRVLSALAPYLPETECRLVLAEALRVTQAIDDAHFRVQALSTLTPYLPEAERKFVLAEALQVTQAIDDANSRAEFLSLLAPYLPERECRAKLREALRAAQAIDDAYFRTEALSLLAPYLPERERRAVLRQILQAVKAIKFTNDRYNAFLVLVPQLTPELLGAALRAVTWQDVSVSAKATFNTLVTHLSDGERRTVLGEALHSTQTIADDYLRTTALSALLPHLSERERSTMLGEMLRSIQAISDEYRRTLALIALAPYLSDRERKAVVKEAVAVAQAIDQAYYRVRVLRVLVPHLLAWIVYDVEHAYFTLSSALSALGDRPRPELLTDLAILMPALVALAGDEAPQAAEGIYHAIQEVCAWWP